MLRVSNYDQENMDQSQIATLVKTQQEIIVDSYLLKTKSDRNLYI